MKDMVLDGVVFVFISCLPSGAQVVLWPVQGVLKAFLNWSLETIVIWAGRVRHDLEE